MTDLIDCQFSIIELETIYETFANWANEGARLTDEEYAIMNKVQSYIYSQKETIDESSQTD